MSNDPFQLKPSEVTNEIWMRYKFLIFIGSAVALACALVGVAMILYNASGTALLDLSRPGYQQQREMIEESKQLKAFEPTGELDQQAIDEFRALYAERTKRAAEWAFSDDNVISDEELGIAETSKK